MPKLKKKSTIDVLSRISGLSKDKIKDIAVKVMDNNKLLDTCSFHIFESIDDPSMSRQYKCKNCNGIVNFIQKSWYEKGIEHSQSRETRE